MKREKANVLSFSTDIDLSTCAQLFIAYINGIVFPTGISSIHGLRFPLLSCQNIVTVLNQDG